MLAPVITLEDVCLRGNVLQQCGDGLSDRLRRVALDFGEERLLCLTLDQRNNRLLIPLPDYGVNSPVTHAPHGLDDGRVLLNACESLKLAAERSRLP